MKQALFKTFLKRNSDIIVNIFRDFLETFLLVSIN